MLFEHGSHTYRGLNAKMIGSTKHALDTWHEVHTGTYQANSEESR